MAIYFLRFKIFLTIFKEEEEKKSNKSKEKILINIKGIFPEFFSGKIPKKYILFRSIFFRFFFAEKKLKFWMNECIWNVDQFNLLLFEVCFQFLFFDYDQSAKSGKSYTHSECVFEAFFSFVKNIWTNWKESFFWKQKKNIWNFFFGCVLTMNEWMNEIHDEMKENSLQSMFVFQKKKTFSAKFF